MLVMNFPFRIMMPRLWFVVILLLSTSLLGGPLFFARSF